VPEGSATGKHHKFGVLPEAKKSIPAPILFGAIRAIHRRSSAKRHVFDEPMPDGEAGRNSAIRGFMGTMG
jgi:hypothetical protein